MSYIGRKIRERRILLSGTDVGLIVPIDHGLSVGPIKGISTLNEINHWINNKNISAIIAHKGTVELLTSNKILRSDAGVIVHLNGMSVLSDDPDTKQMVTDVESAVRLGADAVSLQVNFINTNFNHNFDMIGKVVDDAHKYGLPVLTMIYDNVSVDGKLEKFERMKKLTCAAVALGVDALKLSLPDHHERVGEWNAHLAGTAKVFFAGGTLMDENQLLTATAAVMRSGASGLCAGRNIFQHPEPTKLINKLADVIRDKGRNINLVSDDYIDNIALVS